MIRLWAACRNTSVSRTTGIAPDADDVGQHLSGSDGRQLVDVADDQESRMIWHRLQERVHQRDVDHRAFINDQKIALERVFFVALETERLRDRFPAAGGSS